MRDKQRLITFLYILLKDHNISRDAAWGILNDYVKAQEGRLALLNAKLSCEARVIADEICR